MSLDTEHFEDQEAEHSASDKVGRLQVRAWVNVVATLGCIETVNFFANDPNLQNNMPEGDRLFFGLIFSFASLITIITAKRAFQGKFG